MKISLDDIARQPERIGELSPAEAARLAVVLATLQTPLVLRAFAGVETGPDRLMKVKEAASMLGQDETWIYKHKDTLPFIRHNGRSVRCSLAAVREYLKRGGG